MNFVDIQYLSNFGLSKQYLKKKLSECRKTDTPLWKSKKESLDQRKVLIDLDSIPEGTRIKYGIPTGAEYQLQLDSIRNAELLEQSKEEHEKKEWEELQKTDNRIKRLIHAYESEYQQFLPYYIDRFSYNERLKNELPIQYAHEHAFWLEMVYLTGNQYASEFGEVAKHFPLFMECKKHLKFGDNITSEGQFRRKLKQIREALLRKENIIDIIVPAFYKSREAKKTNDFHVALAVSIYGHPKKYSYALTADMINYHCELEGQQIISESWIKTLFHNDNKLKTLAASTRFGNKHYNDHLMPHAVRNTTVFPGNIWMIDGTPVQFYCWNKEQTRSVRLNLFAVIDVASRKIVGFDISYTEDKLNIISALKMAVRNTGHLPKEIVSDNFSGKKSEEIMDIKGQMEKLGSVWRHARVKNAQDKSYIERFFGAFQSVEQALYDDYIGEGITSRNPNARIDQEYLASVAKEKGLPSYNEMIQRIATMIVRYNKRAKENRPSPNDAYASFPKPNIVEMDAVRTALFFWNKTAHTVSRGMVKIKVRKIEHIYEIHDHDTKMKYQDKKVTVRYDEKDLDSVMLFDEKDNVICECKKSIRINMGVADRKDEDILNTYKVVAKKKSYDKHINDLKADIMDKGLKVVGKESIGIVHPLSLEKNQINDTESRQFLENFREMNGITPDHEYKENYKTLTTVSQKNTVTDARETLLEKKPSVKGSLKVVGMI